MSAGRRFRRLKAPEARRAQKKGALPPVATIPGERLEYVNLYYRNSEGESFAGTIKDPSPDTMRLVAEALRQACALEEGSQMTPELAFGQLDALAEIHARWPFFSGEPPKELGEELDDLMAEWGCSDTSWMIIAAGNIYWLETRGLLRTDEYNGMHFGFSVPGLGVTIIRNTLDPSGPDQLVTLIK